MIGVTIHAFNVRPANFLKQAQRKNFAWKQLRNKTDVLRMRHIHAKLQNDILFMKKQNNYENIS